MVGKRYVRWCVRQSRENHRLPDYDRNFHFDSAASWTNLKFRSRGLARDLFALQRFDTRNKTLHIDSRYYLVDRGRTFWQGYWLVHVESSCTWPHGGDSVLLSVDKNPGLSSQNYNRVAHVLTDKEISLFRPPPNKIITMLRVMDNWLLRTELPRPAASWASTMVQIPLRADQSLTHAASL